MKKSKYETGSIPGYIGFALSAVCGFIGTVSAIQAFQELTGFGEARVSDPEGLGNMLYLLFAPGGYVIGGIFAILVFLIYMIPPILYWVVYFIVSAVKKKENIKYRRT